MGGWDHGRGGKEGGKKCVREREGVRVVMEVYNRVNCVLHCTVISVELPTASDPSRLVTAQ